MPPETIETPEPTIHNAYKLLKAGQNVLLRALANGNDEEQARFSDDMRNDLSALLRLVNNLRR